MPGKYISGQTSNTQSTSHIINLAVTSTALGTNTVDSSHIVDGSIVASDITDATITEAKLDSAVQTKLNSTATPEVTLAGNHAFTGTNTFTTLTAYGDGSSNAGKLTLNCHANSHGVAIQGPPHSAAQSYTLTLPTTAPADNKVLGTNASGQLSWSDGGGSSGNSETLTDVTDLDGKLITTSPTNQVGAHGASTRSYGSTSSISWAWWNRTVSGVAGAGGYAQSFLTSTHGFNIDAASPHTTTEPNAAANAGIYIGIDMGVDKTISGVRVMKSSAQVQTLTAFKIETATAAASSSFSSPTGFDNKATGWVYATAALTTTDFTFSSNVTCRYLRLYPLTAEAFSGYSYGWFAFRFDVLEVITNNSREIEVNAGLNLIYNEPDASSTPTTYSLKTVGNIVSGSGVYGSDYLTTSDDRIKFNEVDVINCVNTCNALHPKYYDKMSTIPRGVTGSWMPTNWETDKLNYEWKNEYGLIAQDVRLVDGLGCMVKGYETDPDGTQTPLSLDYNQLVPILVGAVKEMDARIKILEGNINQDVSSTTGTTGN